MDAITKASDEWKPERDISGKAQISVRHYHESGRFVSDGVGLKAYINLLDRGVLKWQLEGTERPEHNPTRERALELLAEETPRKDVESWSPALEKGMRSSMFGGRKPARVEVGKDDTDESEEPSGEIEERKGEIKKAEPQPDAQTVFKRFSELRQSKKTSTPSAALLVPKREKTKKSEHRRRLAPQVPVLTSEELDHMAGKIPRLSPREREVSSRLAVGKTKEEVASTLRLKSPLLENYLSTACNRLGIQKSSYARPYDRIGALKLVWERYKHLEAKRDGEHKRLAILKEELTDFEGRFFETFRSLAEERQEVLFQALTGLMKER